MLLHFLFLINHHQILLVFLLQIHNKEILQILHLINQQLIHKSNNQYNHLPLHHQHKTKKYQIIINNFHHRLHLHQLIVQNKYQQQMKRQNLTENNTFTLSKKLSDPPTPISQQQVHPIKNKKNLMLQLH